MLKLAIQEDNWVVVVNIIKKVLQSGITPRITEKIINKELNEVEQNRLSLTIQKIFQLNKMDLNNFNKPFASFIKDLTGYFHTFKMQTEQVFRQEQKAILEQQRQSALEKQKRAVFEKEKQEAKLEKQRQAALEKEREKRLFLQTIKQIVDENFESLLITIQEGGYEKLLQYFGNKLDFYTEIKVLETMQEKLHDTMKNIKIEYDSAEYRKMSKTARYLSVTLGMMEGIQAQLTRKYGESKREEERVVHLPDKYFKDNIKDFVSELVNVLKEANYTSSTDSIERFKLGYNIFKQVVNFASNMSDKLTFEQKLLKISQRVLDNARPGKIKLHKFIARVILNKRYS